MAREMKIPSNVIYVCNGSKCKKKGGKELKKYFKKLVKEEDWGGFEVIKTGCTDRCKYAPVVSFQPQNEWHGCMNEIRAKEEFEKLFQKNSPE